MNKWILICGLLFGVALFTGWFFSGDESAEEKPREMCAMPTVEALRQMLLAAGYADVNTVYTPSFRYWKKLMALVTNRPQSGRGIVHAHAQSSGRDSKGDRES